MSNLFNIEKEYLSIIDLIEDNQGEITPIIEELLKINKEDLEKKIKAYHSVIKFTEGESNIIDDEIKRLQQLKQSKINLTKKLKEKVIEALLIFGDDGKSGNKTLSFDTLKCYTTNRKSVEVNDEVFINKALTDKDFNPAYRYEATELTFDDFKYIQINCPGLTLKPTISKTIIGEAIAMGVEVPGCNVVTKPSITFK